MFDLYIKNGKTIDGEPLELVIKNGKISKIDKKLVGIDAKEMIDLESEYFVSAGWIDDHVHCYEKLSLYSDKPDLDGVAAGVTTIIDAGSTGADNLPAFYELAKKAHTNVYAMCNISKTGIIAQDELGHMDRVNEELVHETIDKYRDFVVGIKARMSRSVVGNNGIIPLKRAKEIQRNNKNIPLMVHIGTNPPELDDILDQLESNDIITHCFNGKKNGIFDYESREIKKFAIEAYKRGIIFDVGHGTDSFNFEVAKRAKEVGLVPKTISSDLYHRNRENGPVYNLATCMEKMLYLGYSMDEIIPMVTENPASNFDLTNKGKLEEGFDGDLTIFRTLNKEKTLTDSNGNQVLANTVIDPKFAIVAGKVYETEMENCND